MIINAALKLNMKQWNKKENIYSFGTSVLDRKY